MDGGSTVAGKSDSEPPKGLAELEAPEGVREYEVRMRVEMVPSRAVDNDVVAELDCEAVHMVDEGAEGVVVGAIALYAIRTECRKRQKLAAVEQFEVETEEGRCLPDIFALVAFRMLR